MKNKLNFAYSGEWIAVLLTLVGGLAVLQTFIIGRHFIIPTLLLLPTLMFANLAWYGFQHQTWAKNLLMWMMIVMTCHGFFALFWAKKYREVLGVAFLPVGVAVTLLFAWLSWRYIRDNALWFANRSAK